MSDQFYPGCKIVCIDADLHPEWSPWRTVGDLDGLTKDAVYTIKEITHEICVNFVLREIVRPQHRNAIIHCPGYNPRRFRPLEPKAMELFRSIARDCSKPLVLTPEDTR